MRGKREGGMRGEEEAREKKEYVERMGKRVIIIVVRCLSHSPKVSSGSKRAFTF